VPPQASHHDPYHYNNDTKNEMRKKRKILEKKGGMIELVIEDKKNQAAPYGGCLISLRQSLLC
jgi:hypothetical protein